MYIIRCICLWMILGLMACSGPVRIQKNLEVKPEIFPDYVDVTIPPNIAPLNFKLKDACVEARAILECGPEKLEIKTGKDACFVIRTPPSVTVVFPISMAKIIKIPRDYFKSRALLSFYYKAFLRQWQTGLVVICFSVCYT